MTRRTGLLALVVLFAAAPHLSAARWQFSAREIDILTNSDPAYDRYSPMASAQLFYHYFDAKPDPRAKPPDWLLKSLEGMRNRKVWKDRDIGDVSEAQAWQAPAAFLFEFFRLTRRVFPKSKGGQGVAPKTLINDYELIRSRFGVAVDRLYLARLGGSMQGRGRDLMVIFRQILPEMRAANGALLRGDEDRYIEAVMNVAGFTQDAFKTLKAPAQE